MSKSHWSDKVECEICDKKFTRSARSAHKKTQYHIVFSLMEDTERTRIKKKMRSIVRNVYKQSD